MVILWLGYIGISTTFIFQIPIPLAVKLMHLRDYFSFQLPPFFLGSHLFYNMYEMASFTYLTLTVMNKVNIHKKITFFKRIIQGDSCIRF